MDKLERRGILQIRTSPDTRLDCVSTLEGTIGESTINLRYVPDRHVLETGTFGGYLEALGKMEWDSLEDVALAVLDDVNNEVVARWVQVTVTSSGEEGAGSQSVMVEDRQPKWDNPALLARLKQV